MLSEEKRRDAACAEHWKRVRNGIDVEWLFGIDVDAYTPSELVRATCILKEIEFSSMYDARVKLGTSGNKVQNVDNSYLQWQPSMVYY